MAYESGPELNNHPSNADTASQNEAKAENESPTDQNQSQSTVSDEDVQKALTDLMKKARLEDVNVRFEYLRVWKRLEYYWNNILDIFLDPVSKDWRVPNWDEVETEGEIPPRLINIYRPHGESIVAALSVSIPSTLFHPDDAENPDDIETSKALRNIADLLELHNDAPILFIRALVTMFNQGTVFGYNYYHADPKFGTLEKPRIELTDVEMFAVHCPECGEPLDAGAQGQQEQNYTCPECGYAGPGDINESTEKLPQITGFDKTPKGTVCQEIYSGLNVKVPAYATKNTECGYLLLEFAQSTAMLRSIFQDKADKIMPKIDQSYESFSRLPLQYLGQMPDNASNVSLCWFRPYHFWLYGTQSQDIVKELVKRYPNGCYVIHINDDFIEAVDEDMDEHWTISPNPLGRFIYARPLGENLSTVQDINSNLTEIAIQTAEFGIPETFVESTVLDLKKYGEGRSRPGMMTSVKPRPGKNIQDSFYVNKPAILSQEIQPLMAKMEENAQFIVGDFPSVYGGNAQGGSKTLGEYSQSRNFALQRLGTYWKLMCIFWSDFTGRSCIEYANELRELNRDEKFTKSDIGGNFINVWIRATSLSGRIGRVEAESSEQLPTSWAQKKDAIMQLLQAPAPEILAVLTHPNNAEIMKEAVGLLDIYVPGEEDRVRQLKEFLALSQGAAVPIKAEVDNHQVHIEVLKSLLEGPRGDLLDDNGWNASLQHLNEHMQAMNPQGQPESPLPSMNNPQPSAKAGNPGSPAPEQQTGVQNAPPPMV